MQVPPDFYPYKRNFALIIFCYFQPVLLSSFPYASTLIVRILLFHFSSAALSSIDASTLHSSVLQAEKSPLANVIANLVILISQNFIAILCHCNRNFPLCRWFAVLRIHSPSIFIININICLAHIDHRFNRKHHSRHH